MKRKDLSPPSVPLKAGQDPTNAIRDLYALGRRYPLGHPPHEVVRHSAKPRGDDGSHHENQDPQDQKAPGYETDASGWVRGKGGQSPHPYFDSGPSGNRCKK